MSWATQEKGSIMTPSKGVLTFCALVGLSDATTGGLLIVAPGLAMRLMRIATPWADPVLLRYIGVFVAAVGLSYLYPFLLGRERLGERLGTILEVTAISRFGVALFVAVSIAGGALAMAWLSVALTDGILATSQIVILRRANRRRRSPR